MKKLWIIVYWLFKIVPGISVSKVWHSNEENRREKEEIMQRERDRDQKWRDYGKDDYYFGRKCPNCDAGEYEIAEGWRGDTEGDFALGFGSIRTKHDKIYRCKKCGRAWTQEYYMDDSDKLRNEELTEAGFWSRLSDLEYVRPNFGFKGWFDFVMEALLLMLIVVGSAPLLGLIINGIFGEGTVPFIWFLPSTRMEPIR